MDYPVSHAGVFAKAYIVGEGDIAFEFTVKAQVGESFVECGFRLFGIEYLAGYFIFNCVANPFACGEYVANKYLF